MATESTVDKRRTCSICLEAFRGRQPKLLSCFHTFCSPCLFQLVGREALGNTQGDEGAGEKDVPVTLTCPTCRTCVPLPSGGVSQLQTNFYLEEDVPDDPSPLLCGLCEEGQKAEFQCASCFNCFCSRCRRSHDKLCKSPAASLITDSTGSAGAQSVAKESQDLAQRMEDMLKKVAEEEKKLAQERRATEQDIYERYNSLLRHAAEARDSSLMSLTDVTQALGDSLMNTASLARQILNGAKDNTSEIHHRNSKDEVFAYHFEELLKKEDEEALLTYTITDSNTHVLLQSLHDFMSTVVAAGPNMNPDSSDLRVADADQSSGSFQQAMTSSHRNADLPESVSCTIRELTTQLQDLSERFQQNEKVTVGLQAQNALLYRDLVAVQEKNAQQADDLTALHKEMTSLKDEVTSLQDDLVGVRNKNGLLTEENENIANELSKLKTEQSKTQSDHAQLRTDCNQLRDEVTSLQDDLVGVRDKNGLLTEENENIVNELNNLKTEQSRLQSDCNQLRDEVTSLQHDLVSVRDKNGLLTEENENIVNELSKLKTDQSKTLSNHAQLQIDCNQLHTDLQQLQTDHGQVESAVKHLQSDHDQVLTKQTTMQADVDQLQVDRNKLKTDQDTLTSEVQTLKEDVGRMDDLCKKDKTAITGLDTRLSTASEPVAFHAEMGWGTLTVTEPQTIVCDKVMTNVGGGYNRETGVFTAPVSGTYCFMASSSPGTDDGTRLAALHVVVGKKKQIGYLDARGRGVSTCHCVAHVHAGQTVRLRSFHRGTGEERRFAGARETSFTGMLLQAEL